MAASCGINDEEKLKCIPIMPKYCALSYYNISFQGSKTYSECVFRVMYWYTSEEKQNRFLQDWHNIRLSTRMIQSPFKAQVPVFRELSAKLSSIQRQLHTEYHKDQFLQDQLIRRADTPQIVGALRERVLRTAE